MTESVPTPIDFQSATISTGSIGLSDLLGSGVDADPFSDIEQSVRSTTGGNDPAALRDAAVVTVRAAVTGDQQKAQEAYEGPDDASGLDRVGWSDGKHWNHDRYCGLIV